MKRIVISLLILSAGFLCNAQEEQSIADKWYKLATDVYISDFDSAYICFDRAAEIYREIGSKRDEASCLLNMASIRAHYDDIDMALNLYSIAETAAVESKDTAILVEILNNWQQLLYSLGRMQERMLIKNKLNILEYAGNNELKAINQCFIDGDNAKQNEDYKLAEYYYQKSIKDAQRLDDKNKTFILLRGYEMLMHLKYSQMKYDEAILYGEKSLECSRKAAKKNDELILVYLTMANCYGKCHNKEKTLLYIDSVNMCKNNDVVLKLYALEGQSSSLMDVGMAEQAFSALKSADSIVVAQYGENDYKRINILMMQGGALHKMGLYKESAVIYSKCENLSLKLCGKERMEHLVALDALANSLAFAGDIQDGARKYVELVKIMQEKVKVEMSNIAVSEREAYWEYFSEEMRRMTSFGIAGNVTSNEFVETACEALIFSQALLLESDVSLQELVNKRGNAVDKERMRKIKDYENEMKKNGRDYETNAAGIAELKKKMAKEEQLLYANFKRYGEYVNFLKVKLADVVKAMPDNSILIDYNDIKTATKHYHAAFVTKKSDGGTAMKLIFDWESVEALLDGAPIDVLYKDYMNDSARKLIWEPLSQYAEEGCTIYYVPAGKMHQISLESFTAPDGKLLGEHYKFVRLTSARELVRKHKKASKPASAVLYGGLKYEMNKDSMLAESKKYQNAPLLAEYRRYVRGDSIFDELKYSQEEIDSIEYLLHRAGVNVVPYTGMKGNEESFIALSGNAPEMLHVATHGYYFTPEEAMSISYLKGCDDAMILSGLVMSGANIAKKGGLVEEDVRDGLLSAVDISTMNLRGTDLVVLSACQTGLGKVTPEGVYGLQRAFKLAGVNTIVMTLWSVDDRVTKQFMVKFYEKLVENKWDKRESFNEARDYIRSLYPNSPYYWAGFVMVD